MSYYSDNIIKSIQEGNIHLQVSIHKKSQELLYDQLYGISDNVKEEVSTFRSLKPNNMTKENVQKLFNNVVLLQYPDSSSWAINYHLKFVKLLSIEDHDDKTYVLFEHIGSEYIESCKKMNVPYKFHYLWNELEESDRDLMNIYIPEAMYSNCSLEEDTKKISLQNNEEG